MLLVELEKQDLETPYYDPAKDEINTRNLTDTRKQRLLLSDLNALKKVRSVQELEHAKRNDLLGIMYGIASDDGGGGGF